jgi:hypothetical protein
LPAIAIRKSFSGTNTVAVAKALGREFGYLDFSDLTR